MYRNISGYEVYDSIKALVLTAQLMNSVIMTYIALKI